MENMLKRVFDYQSFFPNGRLSAMIEDVESRYRELAGLDDEDLSLVSAAGDTDITNKLLENRDEHTDRNIRLFIFQHLHLQVSSLLPCTGMKKGDRADRKKKLGWKSKA